MAYPKFIDVEGKRYVSTKTIAEAWKLTPRTVSDYCKKNKIINKFKNGNKGWYIRFDEIKPLSSKEIHKILVLTLQLKNNPSLNVDWSTFSFDDSIIENIYQSLVAQKYIEPFVISDTKRIPYEVILTQKGLNSAINHKGETSLDFSTVMCQWLPIVINIAQLCVAVVK